MKIEDKQLLTEVETLIKAIERELETKKELNQKLTAAILERDTATATQKDIAYRALTARDKVATEKLDAAENILARADQRVISTQIALDRCVEKLSSLRQRHADAFRKVKIAAYEEEANALINVEAETLEKALAALIAAKSGITARLAKLDILAAEAQLGSPPHRHILKNLRHGIDRRLDMAPVWLTSEARKVFSLPINELFRHVLNGGMTEAQNKAESAARG